MIKKKNSLFALIAFVVLTAGIIAGVLLLRSNQDIREKAAPSTSLSFIPSSTTKNPGQEINFTINADTGTNMVTGIDIEIIFDPNTIQLTQMSATSAIANLTGIIKNGVIDNINGKARFAAYTADKTQAISGDIDILSITGTVLSTSVNGDYPISFSATTTVAAVSEGTNVIISSVPAVVTVSSGSISATATATATSVATATATSVADDTDDDDTGGADITLSTATPTSKPTSVTATLPDDIPVTGISFPLIGGVTLGFAALVFSLFLAF